MHHIWPFIILDHSSYQAMHHIRPLITLGHESYHAIPHTSYGVNIRFCQIFPKTAWNWKNLDSRRGHVFKILLCMSATAIITTHQWSLWKAILLHIFVCSWGMMSLPVWSHVLFRTVVWCHFPSPDIWWWPPKQALCILLECILVFTIIFQKKCFNWKPTNGTIYH